MEGILIIKTELADGSSQTIVSTDVVYLRDATRMESSEGAVTIVRIHNGSAYESVDDLSNLQSSLGALGVEFMDLTLVNGSLASIVARKIIRVSKVPSTANPEARSWLHYGGGRLQVQETREELVQLWQDAGLNTTVFD